MKIQAGKVYAHPTMIEVRVLSVDSDPTRLVWVVSELNPDFDALVEPSTLS